METEKLYYENTRLSVFTATVIECRDAGADAWDIVLDRTAFYPEGGGQPCDLGTLEHCDILDVQEQDGVVLHRVDRPLLPGMKVRGRVDMARRIDYTQQHSADHILTGVIHKRYGYDNVGFHMGKESTFIDFNGPLTESDLVEMERVANEAVWMDLPVEISWPDADALAALDYRSKGPIDGPARLVVIPGVDACACCGIHVRRTGEVGVIKILSSTRLRGGTRVEYVAGRRAYAYFDAVQLQNSLVSAALSAKPLQTAAAVRQLLSQRDALAVRCAQLEREHREHIAESLREHGNICLFEPDLTADGVRRLADAVKETCGGLALVLSGSDGAGYHYALTIRDGDVRDRAKALNAALDGRGGGRDANFVQGSVKASRAAIEAYARQQLFRED